MSAVLPHFSGNSYIQLATSAVPGSSQLSTSLRLRLWATDTAEGALVILASPQDPLVGDFLALGLRAGKVLLIADLGE